jgi:hypothetical protein
MEKIALEIARLNETLKILVSIAKEEIRKSEELSKKYEEERKKMSDNIILEKITFYKLNDEGEVLLDDKGNERIFTLKNFVDCSWICEGTDEEHLEEIKEE